MQEQKFTERNDINSPTFSKSVSFCFNSEQDYPLQLISYEEEKGFIVNPEAEKFFESLKDDKLGVIAIVGKNRTGKSSLLNRVILNRNSGFTVGHTINPCTKGIWIWPHIIQIQDKKGDQEKVKVIVMDTEGTDATDQKDNYDTQVFMLAMLLSSYFIYNSVGAIDEKAIQNLSLIVNLSKHLQKTNEKDFEDLVESFPSFLWILRDFALKLVDSRGHPMTAREYLENALKPQKGISESVESKNRIRRFLTNFFKDRDCFMMVRPTEGEKEIQNLQNLEAEKLRPEFNDQVNVLKRKICSKVKPKMFKGKPINGPAFIVLCKLLCNTINNGDILSVENSWNVICKIECERIMRELGDRYEQEIRTETKKQSLTQPQIKNLHKEKRNEILEIFHKRAMGDNVKEYEEQLMQMLKQKYSLMKKSQSDEIREQIRSLIDNKLETFEEKLHNKDFETFIDLISELKTLKADFEKEYTDVFSREVVNEYMFQKLSTSTEVFVDEMITGLIQSDAVNKGKVENLEARMVAVKEEYEATNTENLEKIRELETERSKLKAVISTLEGKVNVLEEEKGKVKQEKQSRVEELEKNFHSKEEELNSKIEELRQQVFALESEKQEINANAEKQLAIQSQQLEFNTQQITTLSQSVVDLKKELTEEKNEHNSSLVALEELRNSARDISPMKLKTSRPIQKVEEVPEDPQEDEEAELEKRGKRKRQSVTTRGKEQQQSSLHLNLNAIKMDNIELENQDLKKTIDLLTRRIENNVEEFYRQKSDLETVVREIERHYKEKQQQDESKIQLLEKTIRNYENSEHSMVEINKKLVLALERADLRTVNFEKKIGTLKKFRKLIKYADEITCRLCKQTQKRNTFEDHINLCLEGSPDSPKSKREFELPHLKVSITHDLQPTMSSKCFQVEGIIDKKPFMIKKSLADFKDLALSVKDQFVDKRTSWLLTDFAQNALDSAENNFEKLGQDIQQTINSIMRSPQAKHSEVINNFLGMKRTEAPYCSVVCCHTESPEKTPDLVATENHHPILSSNQKQESQGRPSHSRKASNRYFKERVETDSNEEEEFVKMSFNTKFRKEHGIGDGEVNQENDENLEQVEFIGHLEA